MGMGPSAYLNGSESERVRKASNEMGRFFALTFSFFFVFLSRV